MSLSNKPIDDKIKQTLQQHEFDFDAGAWEAMNEQLDDRQNSAWKPGFNWTGFGFLLIGLTLAVFVLWNFYEVKNPTTVSNQDTTIEHNSNHKIDSKTAENPIETAPSIPTKSAEPTNSPEQQNINNFTSNLANANYSTENKALAGKVISEKSVNSNTRESNLPIVNLDLSNRAIPKDQKSIASGANSSKGNTAFSEPENAATLSNLTTATPIQNASASAKENTFANSRQSPLASNVITEKASDHTMTPATFSQERENTLSNNLQKLPPTSIKGIASDQFRPTPKNTFSNFEKIKIKEPFRWYLGVEAGAISYSLKNNFFKTTLPLNLNINPSDLGATYLITKREAAEGIRFHLGVKAGIHLRKNTTLEMGFSYLPILYQYRYTYLDGFDLINSETVEQKINQFTIPLRWQIEIIENLRLGFGGGVSLRFLDKKYIADYIPPTDGKEVYEATKDIYHPFVAFWETGIGYDRGLWTLDFKYQTYFTSAFKSIEYDGGKFRGSNFEQNFTLAFGRRFQKYHEPVNGVKSKLNQTQRVTSKDHFNWGVGIATGRDRHSLYNYGVSTNENINYVFDVEEIKNTLKFGIWSSKAIVPSMNLKLQGEIWAQKYNLKFEIDNRGNPHPIGFVDTAFVKGQLTINRLEIPLTLHYIFPSRIRLVAGIGMEFNFVNRIPESFYSQYRGYSLFIKDLPTLYKKTNLIGDIGFGYDWGQFSFDLRYRAPIDFQFFSLFNSFNSYSKDGVYWNSSSIKQQIEVSLKYAFIRR